MYLKTLVKVTHHSKRKIKTGVFTEWTYNKGNFRTDVRKITCYFLTNWVQYYTEESISIDRTIKTHILHLLCNIQTLVKTMKYGHINLYRLLIVFLNKITKKREDLNGLIWTVLNIFLKKNKRISNSLIVYSLLMTSSFIFTFENY